jgi:hypothetical protein
MKKLLLSVVALAAYSSLSAQCNELFISEYVDGTGNDKAMEIFNPTPNPISLSGYSINRYSNGSTTVPAAGGILNLSGTIASGQAFVIVNGQTTTMGTSPAASPTLQAMADQLDGAYPAPMYMNGDDAVTLEKAGVKVDIFGKIGEDPGASWTNVFPYNDASGTYITKDHTLRRKASIQQGVTVNPTAFNALAEWDSLPKNTWTGLGTHTCTCPTAGIKEIDNTVTVVVYPNPVTAGYVNITAGAAIEKVEVYNVMGQQLINSEADKNVKQTVIDAGALKKGVYIVRVYFEGNKSSVVKLSVQ